MFACFERRFGKGGCPSGQTRSAQALAARQGGAACGELGGGGGSTTIVRNLVASHGLIKSRTLWRRLAGEAPPEIISHGTGGALLGRSALLRSARAAPIV